VQKKLSPVLLSGFAEENESPEETWADSTVMGGTITIKSITFSRETY